MIINVTAPTTEMPMMIIFNLSLLPALFSLVGEGRNVEPVVDGEGDIRAGIQLLVEKMTLTLSKR